MRSTLLLLCFLISTCVAQNLLVNPSFESGYTSWSALTDGYSVVNDKRYDGKTSARCISVLKSGTRGASQTITLNKQEATTITASAFSVGLFVSGNGVYAIQLDIEQMDGKKIAGIKASWDDNTSQWTSKSVSYQAASVRRVTVSVIFSEKSGTVWFDNVVATATPTAPAAPPSPANQTSVPLPAHSSVDSDDVSAPAPSPPYSSVGSAAAPKAAATGTVTPAPTKAPTAAPTKAPTAAPTSAPTKAPTAAPTSAPTKAPTTAPTTAPTKAPTTSPTASPTAAPTNAPTPAATVTPTAAPTPAPTLTPTTAPLPPTISIGFKYLILSATADDIRLLVVKQTFDSVGSQYDVIIPATFGNGSFPLTNGTGVANYFGVVFCTDSYGATVDQTAQLNAYLARYKIKSVLMYTYPFDLNGVLTSSTKAANADASVLTFDASAANYISGYNKSVRIPSDQVYCYPAVISNATKATPAMWFNYPNDANLYVAAAFIKQDDGRQQIQFYLDMATWAPHAVAVGPFWLQWLSNNFYLGLRRIYLNAQLDDLFLASDLWDPDHVPVGQWEGDDSPIYRINDTELVGHANWQRAINARLPASSNITIDFPFNGDGIQEAGGFTVDKLYLKAKELINDYTWQSHTYTHPYLDNLTYAEALKEMKDNLLPTTLNMFGSYNHPRYSNKSMVTPSISGFYNKNALQALWDVGIRYVVGDNSRPDLKTPFQYHGFYTTVATNGFAGIYIMPREATYIYYDCSIPRELESEYNHLYTTYYGGPSTVDDIVTREGKRVALLWLAFRQDPYMFHQANMREYFDPKTGKATTLLRHWIEAVVSEFSKYYDLPIHSHTHDLLSQKWLNREARDSCGFKSALSVDTTTWRVTGISGSATGQCSMAITGVTASVTQTKLTTETYGPDTTTWISMNKDQFSFNFKTPVQM